LKLKALDLFCCCGGAAKGLQNAGFTTVGVDIRNGHEYPDGFIQKDVFDLEPDSDFMQDFDLIWASPPCQQFSVSARRWVNVGYKFDGDMIERTRQLLRKTGKPFIIENVVGAPLRNDLRLCGEMFGLRVVRHRIFEIEGFTVIQPPHIPHRPPLDYNHSWYVNLTGHGGQSYSFKIEDWQQAIGISHISKKEHLTQAVPPAYSEYIANYFKLR
jgi:DNA (cytosine-5)-methyltransferase 1